MSLQRRLRGPLLDRVQESISLGAYFHGPFIHFPNRSDPRTRKMSLREVSNVRFETDTGFGPQPPRRGG